MRAIRLAATVMVIMQASLASAGAVRTRDGKTVEGKVELSASGQVMITPAGGAVVSVSWDDVASVSTADQGRAEAAPAVDPHLPAPWQQMDVGEPRHPGSGGERNGVFALSGSGWGIWGGRDSFHFVFAPLKGDGIISARVVDAPADDQSFALGITARDGADAAAPEVSLLLHAGGLVRLNNRPAGGPSKAAPASAKPYRWLRLVRAGDAFSGYCSVDGQLWVPVGSVHAKLPGTVDAGLACGSLVNQDAVAGTMDRVTIRAEAMGPAEGVGLVDGSLVSGVPKSLDAKTLIYTDDKNVDHTLPVSAVAFVFTGPLPADMRGVMPGDGGAGKVGLLLVAGDGIEGTVQSLSNGKFVVDSLLFGAQTPELSQVLSAILRPVVAAGKITVILHDGSQYRGSHVSGGNGQVTLEGGAIPKVTLAFSDVAQVDQR